MPEKHLGLVDGLQDIHIITSIFLKISPKISCVVALGHSQEEPQEARNV